MLFRRLMLVNPRHLRIVITFYDVWFYLNGGWIGDDDRRPILDVVYAAAVVIVLVVQCHYLLLHFVIVEHYVYEIEVLVVHSASALPRETYVVETWFDDVDIILILCVKRYTLFDR